ncbi:hypothetical protein PAPHI01_0547 [Pancytospora philotis]|nr:hypothetical protein PAPHI01_0547 [Pancytospora philotis]
MLSRVLVRETRMVNRLNGFVCTTSVARRYAANELTECTVPVALCGTEALVKGTFRTTVAEIKKMLGQPCELLLQSSSSAARMLRDDETPLYRLFVFRGLALRPLSRYKLVAVPRVDPALHLHGFDPRRLTKLTVQDVFLRSIDLSGQHCLRYIRITNTGLRSAFFGAQRYDYCNLSGNRLGGCIVRASALVLARNQIRIFRSAHHYRHLNLSDNPLCAVDARADVLLIANTQVSHPVSCPARRIVADGTKGISFGDCCRLTALSINSCGLRRFPPRLTGITHLRARNNFFTRIPAMGALLHADLSGNFLTHIRAPALESACLSVNNFEFFRSEKFSRLKSVSLTYNPIAAKIANHAEWPPISAALRNQPHCCKTRHRFITKYTASFALNGRAVKLVLIHQNAAGTCLAADLAADINASNARTRELDWFNDTAEAIIERLREIKQADSCLFVLVTETVVMIRVSSLAAIYSTFAGIYKLDNERDTVVFNNAGMWHVIPVFCPFSADMLGRCHKVDTIRIDAPGLLDYAGLRCPLSLQLAISNTRELLSRSVWGLRMDETVDRRCSSRPYSTVLAEHALLPKPALSDGLGFANMDFGTGFYRDGLRFSPNTDHFPIMLYLKLHHRGRSNPVIETEVGNIMAVLEFLVLVFAGDFIERNHLFCIIGFSSVNSSVLWSLRVQAMLRCLGVGVSIGIAQDTTFITAENGLVSFRGPTLNKLVRIADLGLGIFVSGSMNISHPLVSLVNEGEVLLKGFKDKDSLHSVYFRDI